MVKVILNALGPEGAVNVTRQGTWRDATPNEAPQSPYVVDARRVPRTQPNEAPVGRKK